MKKNAGIQHKDDKLIKRKKKQETTTKAQKLPTTAPAQMAADMGLLQRTLGNEAVGKMLGGDGRKQKLGHDGSSKSKDSIEGILQRSVQMNQHASLSPTESNGVLVVQRWGKKKKKDTPTENARHYEVASNKDETQSDKKQLDDIDDDMRYINEELNKLEATVKTRNKILTEEEWSVFNKDKKAYIDFSGKLAERLSSLEHEAPDQKEQIVSLKTKFTILGVQKRYDKVEAKLKQLEQKQLEQEMKREQEKKINNFHQAETPPQDKMGVNNYEPRSATDNEETYNDSPHKTYVNDYFEERKEKATKTETYMDASTLETKIRTVPIYEIVKADTSQGRDVMMKSTQKDTLLPITAIDTLDRVVSGFIDEMVRTANQSDEKESVQKRRDKFLLEKGTILTWIDTLATHLSKNPTDLTYLKIQRNWLDKKNIAYYFKKKAFNEQDEGEKTRIVRSSYDKSILYHSSGFYEEIKQSGFDARKGEGPKAIGGGTAGKTGYGYGTDEKTIDKYHSGGREKMLLHLPPTAFHGTMHQDPQAINEYANEGGRVAYRFRDTIKKELIIFAQEEVAQKHEAIIKNLVAILKYEGYVGIDADFVKSVITEQYIKEKASKVG